jgi:hypothetical protein
MEEEKRRNILHTVLTSFLKLEMKLFGQQKSKSEAIK